MSFGVTYSAQFSVYYRQPRLSMEKERNLPSPIAEDTDEDVRESSGSGGGNNDDNGGEHEDSTPLMRQQVRSCSYSLFSM